MFIDDMVSMCGSVARWFVGDAAAMLQTVCTLLLLVLLPFCMCFALCV